MKFVGCVFLQGAFGFLRVNLRYGDKYKNETNSE